MQTMREKEKPRTEHTKLVCLVSASSCEGKPKVGVKYQDELVFCVVFVLICSFF